MAKYTEERMFGMLTDIDRSEKRNAYKKYDLPTFKTGGNDLNLVISDGLNSSFPRKN